MIPIRNDWRKGRAVLLAAACALIGLCPGGVLAAGDGPNICGKTTSQLLKACRLEASDDARVGTAICLNLIDGQTAEACKIAAREARSEALAECRDVREARDEVCAELGPGPYDPVIDPANFVAVITNPYAPFRTGAWFEYEKRGADGLEQIRLDVLPGTREILGVATTIIHDVVKLNGVVIEDTLDWLAQDVPGNVWYFGEISQSIEGGVLANIDGSWEAGKGGAKPGLWIKAAPRAGEFYRQEFAPTNAEDMAAVVSLDARGNVPFRSRDPVLKIREFTPLHPGADEFKFYVPGIGLTLVLETGERLELVDFSL